MYTQLEQRGMSEPPVNVSTLRRMKEDGEPIACLTAYDASYAVLVDTAGTDLVLAEDEAGLLLREVDIERTKGLRVTFDVKTARSVSRSQPLARAVGRGARRIVDATAGLGQDAFFLAGLHSGQPDFRLMLEPFEIFRERIRTIMPGIVGELRHFVRERDLDDQHPEVFTGIEYGPERLIGLGVAAYCE